MTCPNHAYPQLSKKAIERLEFKRSAYCVLIGELYSREQLVFVDESAMDRRLTYRTHGWALKGKRASKKGHFKRGKKYSVLPAISLDGILDISVVEGSFNTRLFEDFVESLVGVMNPYPLANSVLIMDNCKIHKSQYVADLCESKGIELVFLPPYSPDFNPIELAFSSIKAWIRKNGDYIRYSLESRDPQDGARAFAQAVFECVTPEKAKAWYRHCGY